MKKFVVIVGLVASLLVPAHAQAAETKFVGGPLTNLEAQGSTINILLSSVPTKTGLYIQQCVESTTGARSTLCNKTAELWISKLPGASFLPTDTIKFTPTGSFVSGTTTVDCTVSKCGIFIQYDRFAITDTSEDQFIPLTFKSASAAASTLPLDEISATINGLAVSTRAPITLGYREVSTLAALSKANATLRYETLDPNCALKDMQITPLKAVGQCAIRVSSAGNTTFAPSSAILPIRLTVGTDSMGAFTLPATAKAFSKTPLALTSNFGEKIKYKATGACSVVKSVLTVRRGNCEITATAPGRAALYQGLNAKLLITGK
jgi:hypothetical protein